MDSCGVSILISAVFIAALAGIVLVQTIKIDHWKTRARKAEWEARVAKEFIADSSGGSFKVEG